MAAPEAVTAYDPPGFLPDFRDIPGQLEQWSIAVSGWFDESIAAQTEALEGQPCQYYNQLAPDPPAGPVFRQEIVWNAFPGTLRHRWGREQALLVADQLLPLNQRMDSAAPLWQGGQWADLYYRPQDEYCEWRVERDAEGRIVRVTFTSEPPEYWQALHGDEIGDEEPTKFPGDRDRLLALYREHVDPGVELEDLRCRADLRRSGEDAPAFNAGAYNPYNRWNTTHGIMHLCHPSNTLQAEIRLGADATILRTRERRLVADADTLIACAGYGGPNRCSDPTIGGSVNQLAALGFGITLANPVGLYMDHLDMTGWTTSNDEPVDPDWFKIVRGKPGMIERAVFEVPAQEGTVSDLKIAGEPIRFGGQLAECMTVKLVGLAALGAEFHNRPARFPERAFARAENTCLVGSVHVRDDLPFGTVPVFDYPEAISAARALPDVRAAVSTEPPPPHPKPRWSRAA